MKTDICKNRERFIRKIKKLGYDYEGYGGHNEWRCSRYRHSDQSTWVVYGTRAICFTADHKILAEVSFYTEGRSHDRL